MLQLKVTLSQSNLLEKFQRLEQSTSAPVILSEAGAILLSRIKQRYLREQDSSGNPWKPSRAGINRRRKGGTGTLYLTGNLWRSIQLSSLRDNTRSILTDVPYAKYLIKEWDFLSFGKGDATTVDGYLKQKIEQALK